MCLELRNRLDAQCCCDHDEAVLSAARRMRSPLRNGSKSVSHGSLHPVVSHPLRKHVIRKKVGVLSDTGVIIELSFVPML